MSKLGLDIKDQIESNNELIEKMLAPNQFILNNTIANLLRENRELQERCPHEFDGGYCVYCYKDEEG